ncbi:aminopeptidase P family protein [Bacteroides coprosuis]|uniref:aminopeptidase P family protein n=1 Tax=Bacteroides coprosuis TaxID=151276 RepID=UPI001D2A714B|nr:aminopeptidase P family protein [Bacteroides coprosuis]HJD91631.1 aminopeptidase P family protein [Bacteroides coprosuis]
MNSKIKQRINNLREKMQAHDLQAVIIPTSDPHMSEYIPDYWKTREWISGFTGSAGTVVITQTKAGLWTDSRYYLQASQQLANTNIILYKDGLKETPTITQFLKSNLPSKSNIGINSETTPIETYRIWKKELINLSLNADSNLVQELWDDRPELPTSQAYIYDEKYAGKSSKSKIEEIRDKYITSSSKKILITALDEIAWILNIRGQEIQNNPVVISYLILSQKSCDLFIDSKKISDELKKYLKDQSINTHEYKDIYPFLSQIHETEIQYDPKVTNVKLTQSLQRSVVKKETPSPIALLKAIRNKKEIENIKRAMIKDGIALTKFLIWLETNINSSITEIDISNQLYKLRSQQDLFIGESFDTIAGYKEHGAIVHYKATQDTNATLKPKGLLLVDSGAQYLDGTTDITRTIALGELSSEEKLDYTLVLKGHIALARAVFPEGTRGSQIDILARLPLWENRKNFLHGTGHGVGHFLCVHEGPQSIRMNENPIPLHLGMLTSNEPGVYIDNSHGVRIENLILVIPFGDGLYSNYYKFETITLCPICTKGIVKEILTDQEIQWLNDYHKKVYDTLAKHLNNKEQEWLKKATAKI